MAAGILHWARSFCGTTFEALRSVPFRWLWFGRMAASATFEMSGVAQGWLVYELTGSAFALGWVGAGWSISTLVLSLYGGAICDRVEKRTVLFWTRLAMLANSLVIGLLISMGAIQVWHLAVSSLFTGILFAFMMPAQQAIISDLVDEPTLMNAISLNALGMGMMGIFSASLAGLMIIRFGVQSVYYLMAALYVFALYTNYKLPILGRVYSGRASVWRDLVDGVRYLGSQPVLLLLLGFGLLRVLLAQPYRTLMPAFAREEFGFDAGGLGLLLSATAAGGLVSSLWMSAAGDMRDKGKMLIAGGILLGLCLLLFGMFKPLPVVLFFLFLLGVGNMATMVLNNTLIQVHTDASFRGRVMSVYMMSWGLTPLGTLPAGAIADKVGVPLVVGVQGALVVAFMVAMMLIRPELKRLN